MGVAAEVAIDLLCAAEGRLGVRNPLGFEERLSHRRDMVWAHAYLLGFDCFEQRCSEQPSKQARHDLREQSLSVHRHDRAQLAR
jgi:hypothetical protein